MIRIRVVAIDFFLKLIFFGHAKSESNFGDVDLALSIPLSVGGQGSFKLHLILFGSGEGSPSNFTPQPYPLIPILHRHHGAAITSYSIHRDPGREVVRLRGAEGSSVAAANTCFLVHRQAVVMPLDDAVNRFWNVYGVIAFYGIDHWTHLAACGEFS